jgi:hypothetical protein
MIALEDYSFLCRAVDGGLGDGGAWAGLTVYCAQRMDMPLLVVGHQRVSAAFVDGAIEALSGTGQRFFPIGKMDARVCIVIECGLEYGYGGHIQS